MIEEIPSTSVILDLDKLLNNYAEQAFVVGDIKTLLVEVVNCKLFQM